MQKEKRIWQALGNVLILKMFMFTQGLQLAIFHPTKGGTKETIVEWIGLGFNS
jgi:hypothetical protein